MLSYLKSIYIVHLHGVLTGASWTKVCFNEHSKEPALPYKSSLLSPANIQRYVIFLVVCD